MAKYVITSLFRQMVNVPLPPSSSSSESQSPETPSTPSVVINEPPDEALLFWLRECRVDQESIEIVSTYLVGVSLLESLLDFSLQLLS